MQATKMTLMAMLFLACWDEGRTQEELEVGRPREGRRIAVGANLSSPAMACFRCHGVDGSGDPAAAFPRLARQSEQYLYASLKDYASGVRENPIMSPIAKELTESQMRDVSAFYASRSGETLLAHPSAPSPDPALLQHGATIAAVGNAESGVQGCINCHGPAGRGLGSIYPYLGGQYASYIEAQLKAWKAGVRRSNREPAEVMSYIARQMRDDDIQAVALYYGSIRFVAPEQIVPLSARSGTQGGR
jgi:cytochrome c553